MVTADGYAPVIVPNVTAGERELTVTVQKGLEMADSVADSTGSALQNANVWAMQLNPAAGAQPAQASAQTDEKGNFNMVGLAPGEYRVIVRAQNLAPAILPSVAAGSTSVRAVLEVGVSLSGSIADESGTAFTGYNGHLQLMLNDISLCGTQINRQDGTFEFKNVPSNQKWKLMGWAWSQSGQYQLTHEGEVESGATEVKVVAKLNR